MLRDQVEGRAQEMTDAEQARMDDGAQLSNLRDEKRDLVGLVKRRDVEIGQLKRKILELE